MTRHIMTLNVHEIGRLLEPRDLPVQMFQPGIDFGIIVADGADVGFKVLHVHRIETDDGRVETDIRFCQFIAEEIFRFGEHVFDTIQRFEKWKDVIFVSLLGCCKATFVHAIVDSVVYPRIRLVNQFRQFGRVECNSPLLLRQKRIEFRIKHSNNFTKSAGLSDEWGTSIHC